MFLYVGYIHILAIEVTFGFVSFSFRYHFDDPHDIDFEIQRLYQKLNITHENVHMIIITGMRISRNGTMTWHSKWKRLPTAGVAYYRQLQEPNGRICERQLAAGGRGSGMGIFLLVKLY